MKLVDHESTMILQEWPPNISQIRAVLPVSERNIFAYGGKIYSPATNSLPVELIAHEWVHFAQQGLDSEGWWKKFLKSPIFRLSQEIPAHRREYEVFCLNHKDRNARSRCLREIAARLAHPMYGRMIPAAEAMRLIR